VSFSCFKLCSRAASRKQIELIRCVSSEISKSFENVTAESMSATKKLDDLYYSILDKLPLLQSSVHEMQDLELRTKQTVQSFDFDADKVKTEIEGKINVFAGFEKQNQRIESFEYDIKQSKEQTEEFTKSLENARARVRGLENQEAEIQSTITCKLTKTHVEWRTKTRIQFSFESFGLS
jgi:chromosome segregation ATPase